MTDNDPEYLARLPNELLILVAEASCLSTQDLHAFARAGQRYADVATPVLYRKNISEENASAFLWAVLKENTKTMALLVHHGADINSVEASQHLSESSPYQWIRRLHNWNSHAAGNTHMTSNRPWWRSAPSFTSASSATLPSTWLYPVPAGAPQNPLHFAGGFQTGPPRPPRRPWRGGDRRMNFRFAPLALAARKGLTTAAKWLLENGAGPEVLAVDLCRCDNDPVTSGGMWPVPHHAARPVMVQPQWTALHLAIHYGHDDIVELLAAHGADTRQVCRSTDGPCSALHTAFIHQRVSIIEFLMNRFKETPDMVDINARGRGSITPLHIAYCVQLGSRSLVDLALKFGAYVNLEYEIDGNQWTLFSMACVGRDWDFAMRLLLKLGANPDFDLEQRLGGRWTTDNFRRSIGRTEGFSSRRAWALARELDRINRDHEIARLEL